MAEHEDVLRGKPNSIHKSLTISLPIPPSVNSLYYNDRKGGKRLTAKAEHYIRDAKAIINQAVEDQKWVRASRGVWVYVDMVYYFPDRRIRDSHNCLKVLMDVMQGKVYQNDYSALPRIQGVEYDKENPRVELKVTYQTAQARTKGKQVTKQKPLD